MMTIDARIRDADWFLRRRDLLRMGYNDRMIRAALAAHRIFRVRQGWYSVPDAPAEAIRAVRVGGRLTSISALASYGLQVPRRPQLHVAVRPTACRLRRMDDRHRRLDGAPSVRVHWVDHRRSGESIWRVSPADALLAVLVEEPRDIAVACASAVLRHHGLTAEQLDDVFDRAPAQAKCWRGLVSALDDSHGETYARLWFLDVGIAFTQQVPVVGAGRLDFKVGPNTYVEIDGAQHDPGWTDVASGSWDKGHDWDTTIAIGGGVVLRYTYRQLYGDWPRVLAAIRRTVANDVLLTKLRVRHPYVAVGVTPVRVSRSTSPSHVQRKRRRFATSGVQPAAVTRNGGVSPAFSVTTDDAGRRNPG